MKRKLISCASLCIVAACSLTTLLVSESAVAQTASAAETPKQVRASNRALARAVGRALSHQKGLNSADIRILSREGVISLEGSVPVDEQIQLASDAAGRVAGVSSVKSYLTVREPGR